MQWDDVSHAAAFLLGTAFGVLIALRTLRAVTLALRHALREREKREED